LGGTGGPSVSPGLLWLAAGRVGPRGARGMPAAVLELRLADQCRRPGVLDELRRELVVGAVEAVTDARWVLLYVERWLAAPREHPGRRP
jgi:hypothetical protein